MLDFSERRELREIAPVLGAVQAAATGSPVMLVGAIARDLLLLHAHGIDTVRATNDIDVAIAVPDWATFERLRVALLSKGFRPGPVPHKLFLRDFEVDVIPFGALERPDRQIAWPPDGGHIMSVLGFSEALLSAIPILLPERVQTKVVSLPAMAILKVVAWRDRKYEAPRKDAGDLWLLLRTYAEAGNEALIYEHSVSVLEATQFDVDLSGAWLLGSEARRVMDAGTDPETSVAAIRVILDPEIDPDGPLRLVGQMPWYGKDRQLALLTAFHSGFAGAKTP